jgi:hypothetical protein
LAISVRYAITPYPFEVDSVSHPTGSRLEDGITRLVGSFVYAEALSAVLQHLGHEGQGVEFASRIKREENFGPVSHLD